jgi:hypothetical protein
VNGLDVSVLIQEIPMIDIAAERLFFVVPETAIEIG